MTPGYDRLKNEIRFITSRSSGPGGQNVNKVSTKVTLRFDVMGSELLSQEEKDVLVNKLKSKITTEGIFSVSSDESRSQLQNKQNTIATFDRLMKQAFTKPKKRKPTKPSASSVEGRIKKKRKRSEVKKWRQRPAE